MPAASFLDAPPIARPLWIAAGAGAVFLHAAVVALAVVTFQAEDFDDDVGAPAIEIALDMAAPRTEPTELPPGPEAEASAASPAQVEQQKKVERTDLPKDEPVESNEPDRVVAREAQKKPDEEKPETSQQQANPSAESVASEATAPQSSDARQAPVSTTPVQGAGATAQRIKATWQKRLVAHLDRHKRYPAGDARRSIDVLVAFTLDRSGHIAASSIARSSGVPAFDAAALAMMQRSDPVPTPPPLVADEGLSFVVPVVFRAQK